MARGELVKARVSVVKLVHRERHRHRWQRQQGLVQRRMLMKETKTPSKTLGAQWLGVLEKQNAEMPKSKILAEKTRTP